MIRPDLDGLLLSGVDESLPSLVFQGCRHHLTAEVLDALFEAPQIKRMDISDIDECDPLDNGTCLVRGRDEGSIYLMVISRDVVRRHLIKDYESFTEFHFSLEKVVQLPRQLLKLIPEGHDLTGALSRVGRW